MGGVRSDLGKSIAQPGKNYCIGFLTFYISDQFNPTYTSSDWIELNHISQSFEIINNKIVIHTNKSSLE